MERKFMLAIVQRITDLAFKLKPPNMITPEIVQCCIELRMLINYNADQAQQLEEQRRTAKFIRETGGET